MEYKKGTAVFRLQRPFLYRLICFFTRAPAQCIRPRRPGLNRVLHVNLCRRDGQSACAHNFGMWSSFALRFKLRRDIAEVFPDRQMLRACLLTLAAADAVAGFAVLQRRVAVINRLA